MSVTLTKHLCQSSPASLLLCRVRNLSRHHTACMMGKTSTPHSLLLWKMADKRLKCSSSRMVAMQQNEGRVTATSMYTPAPRPRVVGDPELPRHHHRIIDVRNSANPWPFYCTTTMRKKSTTPSSTCPTTWNPRLIARRTMQANDSGWWVRALPCGRCNRNTCNQQHN